MPPCIASGAEAPGKLSLGSGVAEGGGGVVRACVLRRAGVPGDGRAAASRLVQEQTHRMGI